ncbi:glycosyltransferase family 2 protein [Flavobacterium subsaxonicum]|uniref:glycosyltransferase family 2 protein n=1 Tax=Flavobacterium subsaxonicum TaxID=426226 RepID=UPI00040A1045|nr:glycosyltransferase family 2 protein [Flavobacterium subsaxonicum]
MKLSIITINLNNAQDLVRTIESVNSQTFRDFEFIIIDGASTDGSVEIIKQIEDRLAFWVSERDSGIFNAMNKGIKKASGDYLIMLNAGDVLYDNNTLQNIFESNPTEDILYGDAILESKGKIFGEKIFSHPITFGFFRRTSISHQAAFIKRELHDRIGFYDETLRFASDWKFFVLAFCKYDISSKYYNKFIAVCNCDGLTWNPKYFPAMKIEMANVLNQYFSVFTADYEVLDKFKSKRNFFSTQLNKGKSFIKKLIK